MASIELKSVSKAYGRLPPVLRGVDLHIGTGEFCVFIGPSGCGKSTLLRMVAGLEDITEGELCLDGRRMNEVAPADRGIAMVFQSYALFPHLSVYDNIAFGLQLARRPKDEIDRRVREAARVLQLEALLERKPKALSGGQRQRVAIGRAIVRQPKVFLFDEPLSNLDTALRAQTRIEIARLHRSFEASSTIYVTHDQVEAMTLADKIVLLHTGPDVARLGSVAQCGTPMALFHTPRNRFVAGFLGSPPMNFLPAEVLGGDAGHAQVRLRGGPALRCAVDGSRLAPGASISVGVRPEHLLPGDASGPCLQGEVTLVERLGTSTIVYLDAAGAHDLVAVLPGGAAVRSGDRLALAAPPQVLHVFDEAGDALPRRVDALEGLGSPERT